MNTKTITLTTKEKSHLEKVLVQRLTVPNQDSFTDLLNYLRAKELLASILQLIQMNITIKRL